MISRTGGYLAVGLTVGSLTATIVLLSLSIITLPFNLDTTIVSAVIGGIIAGIAAFTAQWIGILEGAEKEASRNFERRALLAKAVYFRILGAADYLQKLNNYYRTHTEANLIMINKQPVLVRPMVAATYAFDVTVEEKAALLQKKTIGLLNGLGDLERSVSIVVEVHKIYEQKFINFHSLMKSAPNKKISGRDVAAEILGDEYLLLEAATTLGQMRELLRQSSILGNKTLDEIVDYLNEEFKMGIELEATLDLPGAMDDYANA